MLRCRTDVKMLISITYKAHPLYGISTKQIEHDCRALRWLLHDQIVFMHMAAPVCCQHYVSWFPDCLLWDRRHGLCRHKGIPLAR